MAVTITKRLRRTPLAAAVAAVVGLCGLPGWAWATDFAFEPSVQARYTLTDNVRLTRRGTEISDHIRSVRPGFQSHLNTRRVQFAVDYAAEFLDYSQRDLDHNTLHFFSGTAHGELLPDWLFVEANGAAGQVMLDPFGAYPIDPSVPNATASRTNTYGYRLSPYLRHTFGKFAMVEARRTRETFNIGTSNVATALTDRQTYVVTSGEDFNVVGWGLLFNDETTSYEDSGTVGITTYFANVSYRVTPRLALTARGGHEKYGYVTLARRPEGNFWNVGFNWAPSQRTNLEFTAGRRFFGNTYSLDFAHRMRRLTMQASYKEDINTTQQKFAIGSTLNTAEFLDRLWQTTIPNADARRDAVALFMRETGLPQSIATGTNSFANRYFLEKLFQSTVALTGRRNTFLFSAFHSRRQATSGLNLDIALLGNNGNFVDYQDLRQVGGQLTWRYGLSPRSALSTSVSNTRSRSVSEKRQDNSKVLRISLSHRFSRTLRGEAELRTLHQSSNIAEGNVRENMAALSLTAEF